MTIEPIAVDCITPLHEPRQKDKLRDLANDIKREGWTGRPLLVIERNSDYLAWTGSHRIAAAKQAGLTIVPCYVIQESELTLRGFDAERGHIMDYERLEILRKIEDESAVHLMLQEGKS